MTAKIKKEGKINWRSEICSLLERFLGRGNRQERTSDGLKLEMYEFLTSPDLPSIAATNHE